MNIGFPQTTSLNFRTLVFALVMLTVLFVGVPAAWALGVVKDLPYIGPHWVTCSWHEDCLSGSSGNGIDFGMNRGETIYASGAGYVYSAGWASGWGYQVVVRHNDGSGGYYYTRYAHLDWYFPSAGSYVGNGSPIGYAGDTGNAEGVHLHFEMYHNGLTAADSIPFTPIYGLRGTGTQYDDATFDEPYIDQPTHDRFDGSTLTVDDRSDVAFYTKNWWSTAPYGFDRGGYYNALTHWTYSNGSTIDSTAYWEPNLIVGKYYRVYVFIPDNYGTSRTAHYQITNGYSRWDRTVDQLVYANDWAYLGRYKATDGWLSVRLDDASGESPGSTYIAADAVMFVP